MPQSDETQRYRLKLGIRLIRIPSILLNTFILALFSYSGFVALTRGVIQFISPAGLFLIPAFCSLVFFALTRILLLTLSIGFIISSYVTTLPNGLEIRHWPHYRVRLRWEDVERMGKRPGWGASYEQIRLEKAEELAEEPIGYMAAESVALLRFVRNSLRSFSLRSIEGYPKGNFAAELRQYALYLFEPSEGAGG